MARSFTLFSLHQVVGLSLKLLKHNPALALQPCCDPRDWPNHGRRNCCISCHSPGNLPLIADPYLHTILLFTALISDYF